MLRRRGQKSYECIKKAWHNDRHQPIRGSIIKEIFRVANETHTSQTKRNKEWQQKLPIVIFKAEEIIYSKANSKTEYVDLETLGERISNAINTIISRDESTETGDLLQPCIEAALILGCTARRGSRSQRDTRSYLNNSRKEPNSVSPSIIANVVHGSSSDLLSILPSEPSSTSPIIAYNSNPARVMAMNSTQLHMESGSPHTQLIASMPYASPLENMPPSSRDDQTFPIESNLGYSYPLYYGAPHKAAEPQNFFTCNGVVNASNSNTGEIRNTDEIPSGIECGLSFQLGPLSVSGEIRNTDEIPLEIECDLSLHLGPLSVSCAKAETRSKHEVGSSNSQQGTMSYDQSLGTSMKCKATVSNLVEAGHLSYHPKFSADFKS